MPGQLPWLRKDLQGEVPGTAASTVRIGVPDESGSWIVTHSSTAAGNLVAPGAVGRASRHENDRTHGLPYQDRPDQALPLLHCHDRTVCFWARRLPKHASGSRIGQYPVVESSIVRPCSELVLNTRRLRVR